MLGFAESLDNDTTNCRSNRSLIGVVEKPTIYLPYHFVKPIKNHTDIQPSQHCCIERLTDTLYRNLLK